MTKKITKKRTKKDKNVLKAFLAIIVLIILVFFLLFLFGYISIPQFQFPRNVTIEGFEEEPTGECTLTLDRNIACVGDSIMGTLVDGKNANCVIAYNFNNMGWTLAGTAITNEEGRYTQTETAGTAGYYIFAAICVDENNVVCRTNDFDLVVNICNGDSDGDGFPDDVEEDHGTDPNDPNDYPGSGEDAITYTCGQTSDCYGTCPASHPNCYDIGVGEYTWSCMCSNYDQEVHTDWKPGGTYYNEHEFIPPECYDDYDCATNYFCFEEKCEPRCEDIFGTVRTNYLGAWYSACWDGCGTDRDCCATTYFYYDGATQNGEQWYYYACEWVEGQRCSSFNGCVAPGGNHP